MIAERGRGRLPRETPRETDFAAERPEGDGFRLVSVSLARFRDIPPGKLPRGRPRETPPAARLIEGDRAPAGFFSLACFHGIPTGQLPRGAPRVTPPAARPLEGDGLRPHLVSLAHFHGTRQKSCRGTPRGRRILPRGIPRVTDSARFPSPSRALAAAAAQPAPHAPPLARKRPASKGGPSTQSYARVLELTGSARRRGKKKCTRRTRCTRPR